jgi:hypothetical protein
MSPFTPGGFAYDAVSRRFVIGDVEGRRVVVVGVDTRRAVDMVRAESARFQDVVDLAIDPSRGDLWVTSRGTNGEGALHRLQLVSGRPLRIHYPPGDAGPVRLGHLAAARSGRVLVVDELGWRVMAPTAAGTDLRVVAQLSVRPVSVTLSADRPTAYVAHAEGIVAVDLDKGTSQELRSAVKGATAGFERLRTYRDGLAGVQRVDEGTRRLVFLPLQRRGLAAGEASVLDVALSADPVPPFLAVVDEDISYLVPAGVTPAAGNDTGLADSSESVIHRLQLN